jgi:hypothetical protein
VVEEFVVDGTFQDTHHPARRRLMAQTLVRLIGLTRAIRSQSLLAEGWNVLVPSSLWPKEAHSPMFDFAATQAGGEWIDAIAGRAKPLAVTRSRLVLGHTDWSGKHFRFGDDEISVIYDWDSLRRRTEHQIVGTAAMTFTTNPDLVDVKQTPTPEEVRGFVDDYADARFEPLTKADRKAMAACATFIAAYTARCEHAASWYDAENDPNSFTTPLRTHGLEYLKP